MVSPVMCTYEAEARFLNGCGADAIDLMKRCWGSMVQKGAESYWEFAPNSANRWSIPAHGWTSGCTYLLGAYVMGVRPMKKGDFAVRCEVFAGKQVYTLVVPKCTEIVVDLPEDCSVNVVRY